MRCLGETGPATPDNPQRVVLALAPSPWCWMLAGMAIWNSGKGVLGVREWLLGSLCWETRKWGKGESVVATPLTATSAWCSCSKTSVTQECWLCSSIWMSTLKKPDFCPLHSSFLMPSAHSPYLDPGLHLLSWDSEGATQQKQHQLNVPLPKPGALVFQVAFPANHSTPRILLLVYYNVHFLAVGPLEWRHGVFGRLLFICTNVNH